MKSQNTALCHETIKPTVKEKIIAYYMTLFYIFAVLLAFIGAIIGSLKLSTFLVNFIAPHTPNPQLCLDLKFVVFLVIMFLINPLIFYICNYLHEKAEIGKYQDLLDKIWWDRTGQYN